jgi:hypothetical protein
MILVPPGAAMQFVVHIADAIGFAARNAGNSFTRALISVAGVADGT